MIHKSSILQTISVFKPLRFGLVVNQVSSPSISLLSLTTYMFVVIAPRDQNIYKGTLFWRPSLLNLGYYVVGILFSKRNVTGMKNSVIKTP